MNISHVKTCTDCGNEREHGHRYCDTCAKRRAKRSERRRLKRQRLEIMQRAGWRCEWCGTHTPPEAKGLNLLNSPEVDHVLALALGGGNGFHNLQLLCRCCNWMKRARTWRTFEDMYSYYMLPELAQNAGTK